MNKPVPDLFVDAVNIYKNAVDSLPLCGLNYTLPKLEDVETKKYCVKDIHAIAKKVNETVYSIMNKNYT